MKIKIIDSYKNAHLAKGLTVIVDVLRAFTTCCFIFNNGAKKIIPVADVERAYKLIKSNPHFISIGERKGLKLPGFDYGNSPAEIANINMKDKTVIFTTSAGTQGIINAINADEIITGAFVNAQAVIDCIKKQNPQITSFVNTNDQDDNNEDFMYTNYIKSHLENKPLNFDRIKKYLINHPTTEGFLKKPMTKYSQKDFYLSLDLDRFNFVIKAKRTKNHIYLKKLNG
jgi:2-phosphosulfolactate phosphatase